MAVFQGVAFGPDVKSRPASGVENIASISKHSVHAQRSLHTFFARRQIDGYVKNQFVIFSADE